MEFLVNIDFFFRKLAEFPTVPPLNPIKLYFNDKPEPEDIKNKVYKLSFQKFAELKEHFKNLPENVQKKYNERHWKVSFLFIY